MGLNLLVNLTQQPFHSIITQIEMGSERHNNLLGILTVVDSNFLNSITTQVYLQNTNRLFLSMTSAWRIALLIHLSRSVCRRLKLWRRLQILLGLLVPLSGRAEVHGLLLLVLLWRLLLRWAVSLGLLWRIKWWLFHGSWTKAIIHLVLSSWAHLMVRVLLIFLRLSLVVGLLLLSMTLIQECLWHNMTLGLLNRIDLCWSIVWVLVTLVRKGMLSAWSLRLRLLLVWRYISVGLSNTTIWRILIFFLIFLSWLFNIIILLSWRGMWSSRLHLLHPLCLWLLDSISSRIWSTSSWSCPWTGSISLPWPSSNRFERVILLLLCNWLSIILRLVVLRRLLSLILILLLHLWRLSVGTLPLKRKVLILESNLLDLLRVQKESSSIEQALNCGKLI